jgi:Peptidase S24-like
MPSTRADVALDFVQVLLAREGSAWVRAASCSMRPLIQPGDELLLSPLHSGAARTGMIVAYRRDGMLIVHRVLQARPDALVTRGDALPTADAPVSERALVARVVAIRSAGRRVLDLGRAPWPLIGVALAGVARLPGTNPIVRKALRLPFYLAAVLRR